jgi:hypothetical protein
MPGRMKTLTLYTNYLRRLGVERDKMALGIDMFAATCEGISTIRIGLVVDGVWHCCFTSITTVRWILAPSSIFFVNDKSNRAINNLDN